MVETLRLAPRLARHASARMLLPSGSGSSFRHRQREHASLAGFQRLDHADGRDGADRSEFRTNPDRRWRLIPRNGDIAALGEEELRSLGQQDELPKAEDSGVRLCRTDQLRSHSVTTSVIRTASERSRPMVSKGSTPTTPINSSAPVMTKNSIAAVSRSSTGKPLFCSSLRMDG